MSDFSYKLIEKDSNLHISLVGNLVDDFNFHSGLKSEIDAMLEKGVRKCIVDLSKVNYMSSNGIGWLITLLTKFRNKGGDIELINISEQVKKLLLITKLNAIFEIN